MVDCASRWIQIHHTMSDALKIILMVWFSLQEISTIYSCTTLQLVPGQSLAMYKGQIQLPGWDSGSHQSRIYFTCLAAALLILQVVV